MGIDELTLGSRETCRFYRITKTTLANWVSQGFPRSARNQYPLLAGFEWWRKNIAEDTLDAMKAAKLRRETAKALREELKAKQEQGELIVREQSKAWLRGVVSEARQGFLNLPRRMAASLAVLSDEKEIEAQLRSEVYRILRVLGGHKGETK